MQIRKCNRCGSVIMVWETETISKYQNMYHISGRMCGCPSYLINRKTYEVSDYILVISEEVEL